MNDMTACSPRYEVTFSPISILMPRGEGVRGEEELSDQGRVCKLITGLGLFLLKSLFTQNLPAG